MAGNNDRIQGYNTVYRDDQGPINFYSFDLVHGRPSSFIYRNVTIVGGGDPAPDHQGHIVPQNILNEVLDDLMNAMAAQCNDLQQAITFIANGPAWMLSVYNYGFAINAPMFDFEKDDPEAKLGNFFSIVTWNPINICRAPEDKRRNGEPGNHIDWQVADYLNNHQAAQGVNAEWLASLQTLMANPNNIDNINDYIAACSTALANQIHVGIGYYSFPWQNNSGVLSPQ